MTAQPDINGGADALTSLDAARRTAREQAESLIEVLSALLAEIYPNAAYVTVHTRDGFARITGVYTAGGGHHHGPAAGDYRSKFPPHLIGDWPLSRLPKRITRKYLGRHADASDRTLNDVFTDIWRAGGRLPQGRVGRSYLPRLKLR